MSHGLKLLLLASGTIITLMIVTISFNLARQAKSIDEKYIEKLAEHNHDLDCSEITMYDGISVYGSDVVNFMKHQLGGYQAGETAPLKITVITKLSPQTLYTYSNKTYLKEVQNFADARYIRPLSKYVGEVVYNENGVITGVIFTVQ